MYIDEFFSKIDNALKGEKFRDCSYPVYRGHSKSTYELLPTLLRDYSKTGKDAWTLENNLYCDFRSLVGPRVSFESSWQTLFAMRHEGIPTRLLDWTENIGTALFFALDSQNVEEPHIWMLNPNKLNSVAIGDSALLNPEEDMEEYHSTYAQVCFDLSIVIKELPFAIYPNRSNVRLFAQRGLFTIHGKNESKMEATCDSCLTRIDIPLELIPKLKNMLRQFGINKYSVYPDFKGLADYLKDYYNY